ncbi:hypothetical protein OBBRIDRAFT_839214 [Obba rivulosa]|uniref:Fungal-type protein kinase domain-containing protein n=1 Tax=Obba rivulosa TaxID=1052685 RepID=A0A8E2AIE5_9APHY|nr:hypothetical protein OBBRIDRAFT_839214 [Obba rivulosa]
MPMLGHIVKGNSAYLKLDVIFTSHNLTRIKDRHWNSVGGVGEISSGARDIRIQGPLRINLSKLRKDGAVTRSSAKRFKNEASSSNPRAEAPSSDPDVEVPSNRSQVGLTDKELQTAKYLHELLSHHVRSYGTGFLIEETSMTLWYCDRMGLVQSESFDIFKAPEYLVLVLAALAKAPVGALGFCPFLNFPSPESYSLEDTSLTLPDAVDEDGVSLGEPVTFNVEVTSSRKLINNPGAIGRGTVVVPVKTVRESKELFGDKDHVVKIAWQQKTRTAEDYFVRMIRKAMHKNDTARQYLKHIVEIKCSLTKSMADMELPRALMLGVSLADGEEERVWRILVMEEYMPVEMLDSVEEFKEVFKGVLQGHHWAWEVAEVLHRDISINNVMFYRGAAPDWQVIGVLCDWDLAQKKCLPGPDQFYEVAQNATLPEGERQKQAAEAPEDSVVTSIEAAASVQTPDHEAQNSEELRRRQARHRTGTGPFMAIDLLQDPEPGTRAPCHEYRHDLESFFYVIVWFTAGFRPETHAVKAIADWYQPRLSTIRLFKKQFITDDESWKSVFRRADPSCGPIIKDWVWRLRSLFLGHHVASLSALHSQCLTMTETDHEDSIKKAEEQRRLEASARHLITVETFIQCISTT